MDIREVWAAQPGPQTWLISCPVFETFFGGSRGGGKALTLDCKVLTPFGWVEIDKLKVGSNICATDGTVQSVLGKYYQGLRPTYKMSWSDGSETICDEDHIWLGWFANSVKKKDNKPLSGVRGSRKILTKQIFEQYAKSKNRFGKEISFIGKF